MEVILWFLPYCFPSSPPANCAQNWDGVSPTEIRGICIEVEKMGAWKSCPHGSANSTWVTEGAGDGSDAGNQTWAVGNCRDRDLRGCPQEMVLSPCRWAASLSHEGEQQGDAVSLARWEPLRRGTAVTRSGTASPWPSLSDPSLCVREEAGVQGEARTPGNAGCFQLGCNPPGRGVRSGVQGPRGMKPRHSGHAQAADAQSWC